MEKARDSKEDEDGTSIEDWATLGVASAPWAWLYGVLISARDPSTSRLGFSGYVTNPSPGTRPGGFAPDVTVDPVQLSVPPIPGPRSTVISGQGFVPFEYVDIFDDSTNSHVAAVQVDVGGRFGYTYAPDPIIEGWHTLTVVDRTYGTRTLQRWFGFFPSTGRT